MIMRQMGTLGIGKSKPGYYHPVGLAGPPPPTTTTAERASPRADDDARVAAIQACEQLQPPYVGARYASMHLPTVGACAGKRAEMRVLLRWYSRVSPSFPCRGRTSSASPCGLVAAYLEVPAHR